MKLNNEMFRDPVSASTDFLTIFSIQAYQQRRIFNMSNWQMQKSIGKRHMCYQSKY